MDKQELINFEQWVSDTYKEGRIRSPVHLSGGNEDEVIKVFENVKPDDWIFTTYRSHYHALLKGMPEEELKQWILDNKSIHLMSNRYKIISSAIVGGTLSQAVGCAFSLKLQESKDHVWCFCGDMTASLGIWWDCFRYSEFNDLPITFVIEDNGLSTDTPSAKAWGSDKYLDHIPECERVIKYKYTRTWPHYGTGAFVDFEDKT